MRNKNKNENKRTILTMSKDLDAELKKLAMADNRSLSNYIVTILEKHVEENKEVK